MIITLKGADFSQSNIGTLDSWFIAWSGSGLTAAAGNATSIKKDGTSTTTLTYTYNTENYEYVSGTVKDATGATVGSVSASNGTITVTINAGNTIKGKITITISMNYIGVGEEPEPEIPGGGGGSEGGGEPTNPTPSGEWLSVLLTGDADAHNKFMNGNLTGAGSLSVGCDVIYAETNIQSLLKGKKIYRFASNGLGENTITLYSNPYVGNVATNSPKERTEIGTVTSTSAQAIGTIIEYSVNNPSAIKENETLSISWTDKASGIKTVEGYNTPVYYLNSGVFKTKLSLFCSFDFYVGE